MQKKLIICGKLYDGITDDLQENMEILIEGNIIKQVGKNLLGRDEVAEVIDLSELTVTPGLIDTHFHGEILDWTTYFSDLYYHDDSWRTLAVAHNAQKLMESGFTSARLLGMVIEDFSAVNVRKLIDAGYLTGSRLKVNAHPLGAPGSHIDLTQSYSGNAKAADKLQNAFIGSGAEFFRKAVRKEVKYGADLIKLFINGGFATPNDAPDDQQLSEEEVAAILNTAHQLKMPTTAHVYCADSMKLLMKYNITCMEHCALADEEAVEMAEKTGTYIVPTMNCYDGIINMDEELLAKREPAFRAKLLHYAEQLKVGREILLNSKVKLGFGGDIVTAYNCYELWTEYACWMRNKVDPFRILKAATMTNAEIMRMDQCIGSIEAGKFADISGWKADLLKDPEALRTCQFVMKDGKVYSKENEK